MQSAALGEIRQFERAVVNWCRASNGSVDWMHRVLVRRILRKFGYPPDLQEAAVVTVLQQAEALAAMWAAA